MPSILPTTQEIDRILAIQFIVAWAGESAEDPKRLGWWQSDLVDPLGGGDFLKRLLPGTHNWVTLQSARKIAQKVDSKARLQLPKPDSVRTIFFWGFDIDHRIEDRIRHLKAQRLAPKDALELPFELGSDWNEDTFLKYLNELDADGCYTDKREGRELKNADYESQVRAIKQLAKALAPFQGTYQLPYFRVRNT